MYNMVLGTLKHMFVSYIYLHIKQLSIKNERFDCKTSTYYKKLYNNLEIVEL